MTGPVSLLDCWSGREGLLRALRFLIAFRAPNEDVYPLTLDELDIARGKGHQFASAKRPGPADEEEGTVAKSGKRKAFSGSAVGAGAAGQVLNNGPKVFDH